MIIATARPPRRRLVRWRKVVPVLAGVAAIVAVLHAVGPRPLCGHRWSKEDVAVATAKKYAYEAYVQWTMVTGLACPAHLAQLNQFMNNLDTSDPWGTEYRMRCGEGVGPSDSPGIVVASAGKDGRFGTEDDLASDR